MTSSDQITRPQTRTNFELATCHAVSDSLLGMFEPAASRVIGSVRSRIRKIMFFCRQTKKEESQLFGLTERKGIDPSTFGSF